ncbi:MAG: sugar phosphate isomerase/epimerase family protein, partial [Planctomycetota bacterium]
MEESYKLNRRELLKGTGVILGMAGLVRSGRGAVPAVKSASKPTVCLFSKPLANRPFKDLPGVLRELSIEAVDLTCRPKGHVLPERVEEDLPRAYELDQGNAEGIIKTVSGLGIRYVKLGYYRYGDLGKLHGTLTDVKSRLGEVVSLCKQYGVRAGFHNHGGSFVGAAMWDVWHLIKDMPADSIGSYFDVRHATVEGGQMGWLIGMNLLARWIIMLSVKDFEWRKDPKRGWKAHGMPLGEGMVRLEEAFKRLKGLRFSGPISLHVEYVDRMVAVGSEGDKANLAAIRKD